MGVSEAYVAAVEAIGAQVGVKPLPAGINAVDAGDWHLAVNVSGKPLEHEGSEIAPYTVFARHKVYFVLAVLDPAGGMIGGGMPEGEFIAEMKALAA